ncbi:Putative bacterial sensory transduction regulator [Corynebacterium mustelae]|uniref:Putative bacterial sensory transduction regulator n=1 Tax=Corynebacterium mustelae TaxID=571915 RepID=A0A0G3GZM7_9CORY|nr:YbjN domain-containing protein [Corynebacterium mustelae]AKK05018.1 Putative bacterial sensory transduction regulator [Corynebacterium mustelae]
MVTSTVTQERIEATLGKMGITSNTPSDSIVQIDTEHATILCQLLPRAQLLRVLGIWRPDVSADYHAAVREKVQHLNNEKLVPKHSVVDNDTDSLSVVAEYAMPIGEGLDDAQLGLVLEVALHNMRQSFDVFDADFPELVTWKESEEEPKTPTDGESDNDTTPPVVVVQISNQAVASPHLVLQEISQETTLTPEEAPQPAEDKAAQPDTDEPAQPTGGEEPAQLAEEQASDSALSPAATESEPVANATELEDETLAAEDAQSPEETPEQHLGQPAVTMARVVDYFVNHGYQYEIIDNALFTGFNGFLVRAHVADKQMLRVNAAHPSAAIAEGSIPALADWANTRNQGGSIGSCTFVMEETGDIHVASDHAFAIKYGASDEQLASWLDAGIDAQLAHLEDLVASFDIPRFYEETPQQRHEHN